MKTTTVISTLFALATLTAVAAAQPGAESGSYPQPAPYPQPQPQPQPQPGQYPQPAPYPQPQPGQYPPPAQYPQPQPGQYQPPVQYPGAQQPGMQAAPPPTDRSHRGFTIGIGVGVASLSDGQNSVDAINGRFFAGGWLSRATALTFDASSYAINHSDYYGALNVYGLGLQQYLSARTWVGGTVGAAQITESGFSSDRVLGLVGRGGYNIFESGPHALSLSLELAVGFFKSDALVGFSAGIGYQLL